MSDFVRPGQGTATTPRQRANRALLDAIAAVWDMVPDQRFGQLVMNLSRDEAGFADTWEWKHGQWYGKLVEATSGWAKSLEEAQRGE